MGLEFRAWSYGGMKGDIHGRFAGSKSGLCRDI